MKVKKTLKGNVKITLTWEEANLLRTLLNTSIKGTSGEILEDEMEHVSHRLWKDLEIAGVECLS